MCQTWEIAKSISPRDWACQATVQRHKGQVARNRAFLNLSMAPSQSWFWTCRGLCKQGILGEATTKWDLGVSALSGVLVHGFLKRPESARPQNPAHFQKSTLWRQAQTRPTHDRNSRVHASHPQTLQHMYVCIYIYTHTRWRVALQMLVF